MKRTQVDCFDFDSDGDHDLIGGFTTTVSEMMQAATKPVCLHFLCSVAAVLNRCADNLRSHRNIISVVTTTELLQPPRWLATTEPTPPS